MFLAEPPQTQYDLHFRVAGIPVRVHPLFWLVGVILGLRGADTEAPGNAGIDLLIWVGVLFFSILIHELGHAVTMQRFGQAARIVLYMMGGLATPDKPRTARTNHHFRSRSRRRFPSGRACRGPRVRQRGGYSVWPFSLRSTGLGCATSVGK
jgi:hypothetical protein